MSEFRYKEIDPEGRETLDVIAEAERFNEWMYQTIRPYCKGKILEVGCGIGNISDFFIREKADITLSDIRADYCAFVRKKFDQTNVFQLDLTHPDFENRYNNYLGRFNTVFALNVVEHIKDQDLAIRNCHKLLQPAGRLIILVPAYQKLYNRLDKELEHYRRYTQGTLNLLLSANGFRIAHAQYFNAMGIPGWYVSGKLQKNKTIPKEQMSLFNILVPAFKIIDKILFNRVGLSVISIGVKE